MSHELLNLSIDDYTALKNELRMVCEKITSVFSRKSHKQEDSFFISFCSGLSLSTVNFGAGYYLKFSTSKTTDKGPNSSEKIFGCDFGIKIEWISGDQDNFEKGIIGQAKNVSLSEIKKSEKNDLAEQCKKMARITEHYIVSFRDDSYNIPVIHIGDPTNAYFSPEGILFDEYIIDHVMSCLHGDIQKDNIETMLTSDLEGFKPLIINIETNLPKPTPVVKVRKKPKL